MLDEHFTLARVTFGAKFPAKNRTPQHARPVVSCEPCFVALPGIKFSRKFLLPRLLQF